MSGNNQHLCGNPPRRGAVIALAVDSTARGYDVGLIDLGGVTPQQDVKRRHEVIVWLQAESNDVYFYFADGTAPDVAPAAVAGVDNTAALAAGTPLAYDNAYCGVLKAGMPPLPFSIDRSIDRFIVVKTAASTATIRFWAGSTST